MNNKYSLGLLAIMAISLCVGAMMLYTGNIIGIVPLCWGALMLKGFKQLSPSNPKECGLITLFGNRTKTTVSGTTFILDWLPFDVVGVVVFDMRQEDMDFDVESIRCSDGVRVGGKKAISASIIPDIKNLAKFDDAKRMKGIREQFDETFIALLQEIAREEGHGYRWMESHSEEIARELRRKLCSRLGDSSRQEDAEPSDESITNIAGFGVKIKKLRVKLTPVNKKIIEADESQVFEELDARGQLIDTRTINRQTEERYKIYFDEWIDGGRIGDPPSRKECRAEIMDERLAKNREYKKIVNPRGINVVQEKGD